MQENSQYDISFDQNENTIYFKGTLRLGGIDEYSSISNKIEDSLSKCNETLTLDLMKLDFLNSSGISILAKFVIKVRKENRVSLIVKGSKDIPWQSKSLPNLQKLFPALTLIIE